MRWLGSKVYERVFEIGFGQGALCGASGTDGWAWRYNDGNALFGLPVSGTDRVATWMHQSGGNYSSSQFWLNGSQRSLTWSFAPEAVPSSKNQNFTVMNGDTGNVTGAKMRLYGLVVGNFFDRARGANRGVDGRKIGGDAMTAIIVTAEALPDAEAIAGEQWTVPLSGAGDGPVTHMGCNWIGCPPEIEAALEHVNGAVMGLDFWGLYSDLGLSVISDQT